MGYNVSGLPVYLSQSLLGQVAFANMFQLLISFLYIFYNSLLTRQLVAAELLAFMTEKRPLRVSSPIGVLQRSSYMLFLPYRYTIPLMIACILLHWLVSRSIFIVATSVYSAGPDGVRGDTEDATRLAFSATAMLATAALGTTMLLFLLLNGLRKFPKVPGSWPLL
ncbi:hypothetical protein F4780DRAFT_511856 [Xylariomycetidae sp. FL0641]|nr:hypothetical protein F4780DRAFT_511856 [Xylariomycetidae sp. FL0641]